ncbi:ArsR/SmtB family transcription factor [Enterococcus sp. AZ192]|uniref:ArsR/SmtB family transcription factor n=1 Tax=unclassified Enterococcus TaxID=2608891 RepID=UPI003D2E3871
MNGIPDLPETLQLIGDPTRIELLTILIDHRYYTVTELSKRTKVSLSTVSYHLKKLSIIGWIDTYKQGRNVYYGLTNDSLAEIIESLMTISAPKKINSYNQKKEYLEIKEARTCYSHLAGELGVGLFEFLIENQYIENNNHEVSISKEGVTFFKGMGVKAPESLNGKLCMDWSERKFHLAGSLGSALCSAFLRQGWIVKSTKNRSITLSASSPEWLKSIDRNLKLIKSHDKRLGTQMRKIGE